MSASVTEPAPGAVHDFAVTAPDAVARGRAMPLRAAWAALQAGRPVEALALADAALSRAESARDPALRAAALSVIAHGERLCSRLRRAHVAARHAAQLFRQLGDAAGEALALSTQAHAACALGRDAEALQAAQHGVELLLPLPPGPLQAVALNYLGTVHCFAGRFDAARDALQAAIAATARAEDAQSSYQPRANLVLCEALRLVEVRAARGALPDTTELLALMAQCRRAGRIAGFQATLPGMTTMGLAFHGALSALCDVWSGRAEAAVTEIGEAERRVAALGHDSWLQAMVSWVRAERAWACGDAIQAERYLETAIAQAGAAEFEPFVALAHQVAGTMLAQHGQRGRALAHARRLEMRRERLRAQAAADAALSQACAATSTTAATAAPGATGATATTASTATTTATATATTAPIGGGACGPGADQGATVADPQWLPLILPAGAGAAPPALEDPLTGAATRLGLRRRLSDVLGPEASGLVSLLRVEVEWAAAPAPATPGGAALTAPSDAVGDAVSQRMAALMRAQVRGNDLVARLGVPLALAATVRHAAQAEAFVLLLRTEAAAAARIGARVEAAAAEIDWTALAPGLRVAARTGVSQAVPGDSADELMHRSELSVAARPTPRPLSAAGA